ncbi:hypothetical protein G3I40_32795 [Streptomyces sp. SID14478]|uniref:hypothetical protein n=1 Tax=Streptomyces sp. SID14478 TaxID=2706073 RepID=UPI0013DB210B|nr:hypothetical protein [Streptomyces sp. SID14478]NEB79965.1 hypothetical protein [Streptomyces sp. SID14478]
MDVSQGYGQQGGPTGGFGAPPPAFAPTPPSAVPGPEFVAADQYSGLVVDAEGVHLEQGPHAIDLPWARLRTVHFQPMDAGISLTAVTADGPVYACQSGPGAAPRSRRGAPNCRASSTTTFPAGSDSPAPAGS